MKLADCVLLIGNNETVLRPEGHVRSGELSSHQVTAVNLPSSLFKQINNHTNIGIFFMLYETPVLFPVDSKNDVNSNETEVGSHILSITVGPGLKFQDLTHNITIVFRRTSKMNVSEKLCHATKCTSAEVFSAVDSTWFRGVCLVGL